MRLFRKQSPPRGGPMPTISEARAEVHAQVQRMLVIVDGEGPAMETEVEKALWESAFRLGVSMMALFFARQAALWPMGRRYMVDQVAHRVEGADSIEIGTKFGKVMVSQPVGRVLGRPPARRGLPTGGAPKKRRGPGKKSKNAKMAAVGVICTLKADESGMMRPVNKRMYATFKSYRALFVWLKAEAVRRGYGTSKFIKVQFVADGADTLWDLQQEFFPDAAVCLDWIHAVEKLWNCGKAVNRGSRAKRQPPADWVPAQKRQLRHGKLDGVIATLQAAPD